MESTPPVDDGLVFLPRASSALELLCVSLYLSLALVAACRALSQGSAFHRSQRSTFQRLMVLFAVTRAASFVGEGLARNLLNRAALCLFFSLVLFQTLLWIDIANPKVSTRSRRIWIAFVVANGLFYAAVLGLSVLHEAKVAQAHHAKARLNRSTLWTGVLPVLFIATGSFVSSLGLVYSTWKMRHRVERVLKPSGAGLRRRLDERVEMKLTRALRFTSLVMGACSVLFLLRTIIYVQRPFSHQGCGNIHSSDVCVVVGYAIPEIVPCVLFLVLMWEVEPTLEIPSRRSLSYTNGRVTSESTPLLDNEAMPRPLLVAAKKFTDGIGVAPNQAIQDDAIERKKRKWRLDLVRRMEQYISEVEDSILRYGATQHAGLTFKPSTMKADADLRFLALNLHQQLMTVGNASPTSEKDVQYGDQSSAARYARLVNSFVGTLLSSPLHLSRKSSMRGQQTDLDSVQFIDDDINDEKEAIPPSPSEESPLEPVEALRRRVISFDSAETIVNKGAAGQDISVPSEQRKLAETIVAMGITEEEFRSIYGLDENVDVSDAIDIVANITLSESECEEMKRAVPSSWGCSPSQGSMSSVEQKKASMTLDTSARGRPPFYKHRMYGTTTVGAFAAHVYGFKSGGVRQMRTELEKLHARLVKEAQASSDLTMDALERKYNELKWDVERRLEVAFCQAMSALVTCFQQTLYVHTHDHRDFGPHPLKACGIDYLEMLTRVGFLFSVESLLSTYGNELGMLGDTEAAVKELGRVLIKLRPVKSPRAAAFRVSITSGPSGIVIELPIITRRASEFPDRSMHRVPGQDTVSGAIYLSLSTPEQKMRAKFLFQKPIRVIPVIFSQGLNEMQTVANTVGKASLQKEINAENVVELESYVKNFAEWVTKKQCRDTLIPIYDAEDLDRIQTSLMALKLSIQLSGRSKRMAILSLSSSIARSVGGGRVTMCKSAKDRTSMSITLEEANLLVRSHGLLSDDMEAFTNLLRTYGVRRENARKNIGKAQYCFSALQNYMLPQDYQCPPGTGGGSRAYS
ncbi:hypothetical protein JG688_00004406 [Phytophthora aleatoria]|uniref:THH1/TOM1/TOM3 domain-containing protein n=1 Tax=Phytophthora aleatoria TaxID=2496075 RepID=A0A8J5J0T5_9STRA|nr:hypothetical protein JG688_00004406 [Phytophthora aleatoria]